MSGEAEPTATATVAGETFPCDHCAAEVYQGHGFISFGGRRYCLRHRCRKAAFDELGRVVAKLRELRASQEP